MPFTYIARCVDDTLYVGCTEDLASREQLHNEGRGAKYTVPIRFAFRLPAAGKSSLMAVHHANRMSCLDTTFVISFDVLMLAVIFHWRV
jgi:predicted GIY-YIG superfamily endonuclease